MVELLFFQFRVMNVKSINEKNPFNITVWISMNAYKSIPLLKFLRNSYNSISWGCQGMLKNRSDMDVVSNRWESIRSLFRGYIPLGARDIQVQSFNHRTSCNLNWCVCSKIFLSNVLKVKNIFEIPKKIKLVPLITGLPKPAWLRKWFRNNWLRMVAAVCGLHYFISALVQSNFSTIDRYISVFYTYKNSAYYKTRNARTRNNETRNTREKVKHPGRVAEQLNITWKTSRTPQNTNGIPT